MIRGKAQFAPWIEDPDPPDYWSEEDFRDFRRRLRAHYAGKPFELDSVWTEELHPRERGKFTFSNKSDSGDSPEEARKFATERLITDGPNEGTSRVRVVKGETVYIWGASHEGSSAITGASAAVMGIAGYDDEKVTTAQKNLGNKFLDVIAQGQGAGETLYHGFDNFEKADGSGRHIEFKEGDTLRLPLMAAGGDIDTSASYGISYARSVEDNKGATVFEFPPHTPIAGYSRWDRNNTKDFGYTWSEAIVAGAFKVTGIRSHTESGHRSLPVQVVTLEPLGVFDRAAGKWRRL